MSAAGGKPRPAAQPAPSKIGYQFDAMPHQTLDLIREGSLEPSAAIVLMAILRWRFNGASWCWASNRTLCEQTGFSEATIHRALRQLSKSGLVDRIEVASPDPDDPQNRTGYRFQLRFVAGEGVSQKTPGGCHTRQGRGVAGDTQSQREVSAAGSKRADNSAHANIGPKTDRRSLGGSSPHASASRSKRKKEPGGRELDRLLAEEVADGNGTPNAFAPGAVFDGD